MPLPSNVEYSAQENLLRARFRGPFIGLDTSSSLNNMDVMALRIADNANIEENGSISKRSGYTSLLTAAWGSRKIRQGYEFVYDYGASVKLLLYGHASGANTGAFGYVDPAFASVTNITATGLANVRPSCFQVKNLFFFYNGTDDFVYDGTATRQIGITPPASAPTFNANTNGSLVSGGSYIWSYTYYNSVTGAESSPSPLSAAIVAAADPNDGVILNITAGSATTADTIRVYRTLSNGAVLFLDGTTGIASTTYSSTIADAGLSKELELDNTRPGIYGKFKYGLAHENRAHLTGLSTNLNRVHISAIYSEGPHPESFPVKNFVDAESSLGTRDSNVGLGIAGDKVIILKKYSVGRVEKIGVDTTSESADPVLFGYKEISRSVTSVSHFAGCNVYGDWVWLGKDDIYATDGNTVRSVGTKIRKTIAGLSFSSPENFSCINDTAKKRIYITCRSSGAVLEPDWVLVGHYHQYPEFIWTLYRPGINTITNPGVIAASFFETVEFDGTRRIIFGSAAYDGKLYYLNNGVSDNGSPVAFRVRFAPTSFGLDEEEKIFIKDMILAQSDGSNYSFTTKSFYMFSDVERELELVSLFAGVNVWGGFNWGFGNWGANVPLLVPHHLNTKAFYKQLEISDSDTTHPLTFYSYTTVARPTAWKG